MTGPGASAGVLLRSIHHVGIAVHDLDAAIGHYVGVMGATLELRAVLEEQQVEAASLHVGTSIVELVTPVGEQGGVARFLERRGEGLHHVAYAVDDVHACLQLLREAGVRLIDEQPRSGLHGTPIAFLHPASMGGVLTELVQTAPAH